MRLYSPWWSAWILLAACCLPGCSAPARVPPVNMDGVSEARAQRGDPNERGLYIQLIEKLEETGQYYAALAHLDRYERDWPVTDQVRYLRATALRKTGDLDQARALYQELTRGQYGARAYEGLGLIEAARGDGRAALQRFEQASRIDPTNVELLSNLGYAAMQVRENKLAEQALFKAGQLGPQDRRAWSNIAVYELITLQPSKAAKIMERFQMSQQERDAIMRAAKSLGATGGRFTPQSGKDTGRESLFSTGDNAVLQPRISGIFSEDEGRYGAQSK